MKSTAFNISIVVFAFACAPVVLAQTPNVNPLTGTALVIEQQLRRLEELKLETQMLEEQAKQAEIRARIAGGVTPSSQRVQSQSNVVDLPVFPAPAGNRVSHRKATPRIKSAPRTSRVVSEPAVPMSIDAKSVTMPPQVVAIFRSGSTRHAVVRFNGEVYTVAEGESISGNQVAEITESNVILGGVRYAIERKPAFIAIGESTAATRTVVGRDAISPSANSSDVPAWPPEFKSAATVVGIETPFANSGGIGAPVQLPTAGVR